MIAAAAVAFVILHVTSSCALAFKSSLTSRHNHPKLIVRVKTRFRPHFLFASATQNHASPTSSNSNNVDTIKEANSNKRRDIWSNTWFPIHFVAQMDHTKPTKHYLLGAPIVVWYHNSTWFAMIDRCPHRLVPLSEGRIIPDSGDIECPYHGFSFDGSTGQCTRIPQQQQQQNEDGNVMSASQQQQQQQQRGCATALQCAVRQGMLCVHSAPLFRSPTASFEEECQQSSSEDDIDRYLVEPIDRSGVLHVDYFRDLHMDWSILAENVMDPAHLPFTHHGTISARSAAMPVPLRLLEGIKSQGIVATRKTDPPGSLEYRSPHLIYAGTYRNSSFADWNVVYAIPTLPGKCRILVRVVFEVIKMKPPLKYIFNIMFRMPPKLQWILHLRNHKILEDDNIFLHHQMHTYQLLTSTSSTFEDETYLPTDSDRVIIAFHKWLQKFGAIDKMWSPHYTPNGAFLDSTRTLSRHELIERQISHTDVCQSCSKAQKVWLPRIQTVLSISSILLLIRAFSNSSAAIITSAGNNINKKATTTTIIRFASGVLAGLAYLGKQKISNIQNALKVGEYPPPRNKPFAKGQRPDKG